MHVRKGLTEELKTHPNIGNNSSDEASDSIARKKEAS